MGCVPSKKRVEFSAETEWLRVCDAKARAVAVGDVTLARVLEKHAQDLAGLLAVDKSIAKAACFAVNEFLENMGVDKLQDRELHMLRLNLESKIASKNT